jgi:nitroimidazol reductase NimA-like FMN-containing flavoprotein (pyridoxamine 5'-phosphate oxidase superfamily)
MATLSTDRTVIADILRRAQVLRLALCRDNRPHIVPVSFGYHDNALYIHSRKHGTKLELLRANPLVAFEVEADVALDVRTPPCQCGFKYRSVTGTGRAEFVDDAAGKVCGLNCITRQYLGREHAYKPQQVDGVCVVKIFIENMTAKVSGYDRT